MGGAILKVKNYENYEYKHDQNHKHKYTHTASVLRHFTVMVSCRSSATSSRALAATESKPTISSPRFKLAPPVTTLSSQPSPLNKSPQCGSATNFVLTASFQGPSEQALLEPKATASQIFLPSHEAPISKVRVYLYACHDPTHGMSRLSRDWSRPLSRLCHDYEISINPR